MNPPIPLAGAAGGCPGVGVYAASEPAILFAAAFARNQTPMSSDAKRTGATFVTYDSPTGERQSSPKRVERVRGDEPEWAHEHARVRLRAADDHEQESRREQRETENHLERGRRLLARACRVDGPHAGEDRREDEDDERSSPTGTSWTGSSRAADARSVFLSANRFIELPACSYAAQKKITKNTTMNSAITRRALVAAVFREP